MRLGTNSRDSEGQLPQGDAKHSGPPHIKEMKMNLWMTAFYFYIVILYFTHSLFTFESDEFHEIQDGLL